MSGGVSNCGDTNIPSYYTRLDHPEIADFIQESIGAQNVLNSQGMYLQYFLK